MRVRALAALLDERMLRVEDQLFEPDRAPEVSKPAAHARAIKPRRRLCCASAERHERLVHACGRRPRSRGARRRRRAAGSPCAANSPSVTHGERLAEPAGSRRRAPRREALAAADQLDERLGRRVDAGSAPSSRGRSSRRPTARAAARRSRSCSRGSGGPITDAPVDARLALEAGEAVAERVDVLRRLDLEPAGRFSTNARYQHGRTNASGCAPHSSRGSVTASPGSVGVVGADDREPVVVVGALRAVRRRARRRARCTARARARSGRR